MSNARIPLDLPGLTGQHALFRLSGAVKRDVGVEAWLCGEPAELRAIARQWFSHIRHCGPDVLELMHDGCPVACVQDAAFAYVNTFQAHVNVGLFYGAMLEDPAGILQGTGKRMRHVKLTPHEETDMPALRRLIEVAYADIKSRLR